MKMFLSGAGLACIVAMSAVACFEKEWTTAPHRTVSEVIAPRNQHHYAEEPPSIGDGDTVILVCGVTVPEDYDWVKDTALGNGEGEVFLLENYHKKLSLKSGYSHGVSPDPDSHHIIGCDLYTDFSFTNETVLKKNGEELFRYEGRERIRWILPDGEAVRTLGIRRNGDGFSLRENGEAVLVRENGTIVHGLHTDSGHNYFLYRRVSAGISTVFLVEDGLESPVSIPETDGEIADMVVWGQELHILYRCNNGFRVRSSIWDLNTKMLEYKWTDLHFVMTPDGPFVSGTAENTRTYTAQTILFGPGGVMAQFNKPGCKVLYDGIGCAAYCDPGFGYVVEFPDPMKWNELGNMRIMSDGCADFKDGIFALALSSNDGRSCPAVRVGGKEKNIKTHGYLSGISIMLPRTKSSNHQD